MTQDEHRARHVELHKALDELMADYIHVTGRRPTVSTIEELMKWSYDQSVDPKHDSESL